MKMTACLPAFACALACTLAVVAGCAALEVTNRPPALQIPLGNGVTRSFYVQGFYDMQTLALDTDAGGKVLRREFVLTEEHLRSIVAGIDSAELLKLIGPPWRRIEFERQGVTAWDYRYRDTWGYIVEFSALIDARQKVSGTVSSRVDPPDNDK